MVKKVDIARELGLHVATVSRILNKVPNYRVSKDTIRRVFKVARDMGYDFQRQKRYYRRRYVRIPAEAKVAVRATHSDGSTVTHDARIANISEGGALLAGFKPKIDSIPLRAGDFSLKITSGALKGIEATCEVVRVGRSDSQIGICVQLNGLSSEETSRIHDFIQQNKGRAE